ncbi:cytochrome P450 [Xylariomycetidae sp. FL0641]|nr:cytochrome P450 [Xylariomycetidae sp. FL0641]
MRDETRYARSATFYPERFMTSPCGEMASKSAARFTDVDLSYPVWGLGRHACPGRYYALLALKIILVHVLENYDMKLGPPRTSRSFQFRSSVIPSSKSRILFRKLSEH